MMRSLVCVVVLFASAMAAVADDVAFGKLKSKTPAAWKAEADAPMRLHTFTIPKAKGDDENAELAIFFFGPGGGGGVDENVKRWKGFFEAPAGKTTDDVSKLEKFNVGKADLTYLDISGVYLSKFPPASPTAKVTRKANYRMLAVAFECEDGPFFVRLTGPAATVAATKSDFDAWLKNFK